jgi:hypothetical protein
MGNLCVTIDTLGIEIGRNTVFQDLQPAILWPSIHILIDDQIPLL